MGRNARNLVLVGQSVLCGLRSVSSKYSRSERAVFLAAQRSLEEAAVAVTAAEARLDAIASECLVASRALDAATLAVALTGPAPFTQFGVPAASQLVKLGQVGQASSLLRLAMQLTASAPPVPQAEGLRSAATRVLRAESERAQAWAARADALEQRDTVLPRLWHHALADLKAAIRYADAKEHTAAYARVFGPRETTRSNVFLKP